jgi:arylsulfatase A-like enzyme
MNLLVLMTDQQRADSLSCLGETPCRTPNLDRVAAEGTVFASAFNAVPLCSPSRASILTGRWPHAHLCLDNCIQPEGGTTTGLPGLDPSETTLSELLAARGVACAHSGKWHLGRETEPQRGFGRFVSHRDPAYLRGLAERGLDWDEMAVFEDLEYRPGAPFCGTSPLPAAENRDAFVAANALAMLDELAAGREPFALWCSFYGPHPPFSVPEPFDRMYDPRAVRLPTSFADTCEDKPGHVLRARHTHPASTALDEDGWRRVIAHYWGYVSFLDSLFGRLLDRLDALGLSENTAIAFISDHGEMLGDHRLFGKGHYFYEGIMRTPLILRVPGCSGGRVEQGLVSLVDFAPTMLEVMAAEPPKSMQGRSLLPDLRAGRSCGRDAVFAEHHGRPGPDRRLVSCRMVRTATHKYSLYSTGEEELYDLADDPGEAANLAAGNQHRGVKAELRGRLEAWMRQTGDFHPNAPEEMVL